MSVHIPGREAALRIGTIYFARVVDADDLADAYGLMKKNGTYDPMSPSVRPRVKRT